MVFCLSGRKCARNYRASDVGNARCVNGKGVLRGCVSWIIRGYVVVSLAGVFGADVWTWKLLDVSGNEQKGPVAGDC